MTWEDRRTKQLQRHLPSGYELLFWALAFLAFVIIMIGVGIWYGVRQKRHR